MTDDDTYLTGPFAILPDEPWQEKYGGVYSAFAADELQTLRYALRLLTEPEFELAEALSFEAEHGVRPPPISEVGRQERIASIRRQIGALERRANRRRLPGPVDGG